MTSTRSTLPAPAPADDSADVPADTSADFPAVDAAIAGARAAFVPDVDLATRLDRLHRLEDLVRENRTVLEEALATDLGKPPAEAWLTELGFTLEEIAGIRRELGRWMTPARVPVPLSLAPARSRVEHQPLGTVLVMAPWNYPVQLVLSPLAGALAAGNTVVVKPSEQTPRCGALIGESLLLMTRWDDPTAHAILLAELVVGALIPFVAARRREWPAALALGMTFAMTAVVLEAYARAALRTVGWGGA